MMRAATTAKTMAVLPPQTPRIPTDETISCRRCAHYHITHDARLPYGCRALGFKSRSAPCREVLAASGELCAYFAPKRSTDSSGNS